MPRNQVQVYPEGEYTLLVDNWMKPDSTEWVRGDTLTLDQAEATRLGNANAVAQKDTYEAKVARGEITGDPVDLNASPEDLMAQIAALQARLDDKQSVLEDKDAPVQVPRDPDTVGNFGNARDPGGGQGRGHNDTVPPDHEKAAPGEVQNFLAGVHSTQDQDEQPAPEPVAAGSGAGSAESQQVAPRRAATNQGAKAAETKEAETKGSGSKGASSKGSGSKGSGSKGSGSKSEDK